MSNKQSKGNIALYLAVAFGWTWACWIGAWSWAQAAGNSIDTGATLFGAFALFGQAEFWPQVLFAAGVFGPLIGYLILGKRRPFWGNSYAVLWLWVLAIPLLSVAPALLLSTFAVPITGDVSFAAVAVTGLLYFVSNVLTSGTEEFGWRGYLYPALQLRGNNFWAAAWKGGLLWAAWHIPLMVSLYWSLGWAMLPTLAGFVTSIIAMNYITNALYEKSNSIALAILLHALNNTASFMLILLFPTTPFTIIPALMAWMFVGILEKQFYLKNA